MYLLKRLEPYSNVGELINKVSELEKSVRGSGFGAPVSQNEILSAASSDLSNISAGGLIDIWREIVSAITKKHPLTFGSPASRCRPCRFLPKASLITKVLWSFTNKS
ncbi:MAG: hypothetical protein LBU09_04680 [Endomicrobium sp.]|nr:hypothetical protein [Endomicrobium sp.]